MTNKVTAFAPATCGNVCVGYDILGLCYSGAGDKVTVQKIAKPEVIIESIEGEDSLSCDPKKNTAGIVLLELIKEQKLSFGFSISIEKGISLGSGMGGSAASAVAALLAANSFLETPLSKSTLLEYSLKGEELASGHAHADNVAPCLYGGLVLLSNGEVVELPFPKFIQILLIHPHLTVNTKDARKVLKSEIKMKDYVKQSENLAGFITGLYKNDPGLIKKSFEDVLVEPLRSKLTKGFSHCQELAKAEGVLGYALSGSGPSQIALCESHEQADNINKIVTSYYESEGIKVDTFIGSINSEGAKLL